MSSERRPTLAEFARRHIEGAAAEWHHCKVAVVTAVDSSTTPPRVSVKPLVKRRIPDTEDGTRQVEPQAIVPNVPVQFVGAGGFRLTCPIVEGTTGLLLLSDESLDRWLSGTGAEVDPEIDHRFSLNDGIFIPGLLPFGSPLKSWPQDHATLGADAGPQIHLHTDAISLGDVEANTKPVALNGDSVGSGTLALAYSPTPAPVATLTYTPPGGAPVTVGSWPVASAATPGSASISGTVSASATKAKAI